MKQLTDIPSIPSIKTKPSTRELSDTRNETTTSLGSTRGRNERDLGHIGVSKIACCD